MKSMIEFLRTVGWWFIGKAEEFDRLDENVKIAINHQTQRAFWVGFGIGVFLTIVLCMIF